MKIFEMSEERTLKREEAARVLRELADSLARHNEVEFERNGLRMTVAVADEVKLEIELEIETDERSLEIEITW